MRINANANFPAMSLMLIAILALQDHGEGQDSHLQPRIRRYRSTTGRSQIGRHCNMRAPFNAVAIFLFVLAVSSTAFAFSPQTEKSRRQVLAQLPPLLTPLFGPTPKALAEETTNNDVIESYDFIDGPRGLKYAVTKAPRCLDCATPERAQKVKTFYTLYIGGFPEDGGKKIDSSQGFLGSKPFEFYAGVQQVIKAWDLTILDMREGEARRLIVPPELGYGEKGAGGRIPGNAKLYFELELVEVGEKLRLTDQQVQWLKDNPV